MYYFQSEFQLIVFKLPVDFRSKFLIIIKYIKGIISKQWGELQMYLQIIEWIEISENEIWKTCD